MRRFRMSHLAGLLVMVMVAVVPLAALASDTTTIEGEVNDNYQIVASDGQVYEISETPEGDALVENYSGEKVKVTGTVQEEGDVKTIGVTTFTPIE